MRGENISSETAEGRIFRVFLFIYDTSKRYTPPTGHGHVAQYDHLPRVDGCEQKKLQD